MPDHALLVHGYSEQSLTAYAKFPTVLREAGLAKNVVLTAYDSLDDGITIDDLAAGLEANVRALESNPGAVDPPWDTTQTAVFCHSTGALVARRWILNRLGTNLPLPSHLITLAGANHGSAMAQLGRTALGQIGQFINKGGRTPGQQVLTDLDFGSDFLLRLNREWLIARSGGTSPSGTADDRVKKMPAFSMGGDALGPIPITRLIWASSECGSDNTVRISAANLNYTYLVANAATGLLQPIDAGEPVPHLIVPGKSHWGPADGIVASIQDSNDPVVQAIAEALAIPAADDPRYALLATAWDFKNSTWLTTVPARNDQGDPTITATMSNADVHGNSTIVFYVHDTFDRSVDDCMINFLDASIGDLSPDGSDARTNAVVAAAVKLSAAAESRWPIHNNVELGSYSFYVNYKTFYQDIADPIHHKVSISATVPGDCVSFDTVTYQTDPESPLVHLVRVNEFTYVDLTLARSTSGTVAVYRDDQQNPDPPPPPWRPFPPNPLA